MKIHTLQSLYGVKRWDRLYSNQKVVLESEILDKPITASEIRYLQKKRELQEERRKQKVQKYYSKDATKKRAKSLEYYWRKKLSDAKALNKPFKGCNAHHISIFYIVYIPRELHRKHPHSLKNYWRMDEINRLTTEWLRSEGKRDVARLVEEHLGSLRTCDLPF